MVLAAAFCVEMMGSRCESGRPERRASVIKAGKDIYFFGN